MIQFPAFVPSFPNAMAIPMRNVLAIVCARMASTRLPGKPALEIGSMTVLAAVLHRLEQSETVRRVVVATPRDTENQPLWDIATQFGCGSLGGSENNVVSRMMAAVEQYREEGDYVLRALTDQPLLDWEALDMSVRLMQTNEWDFVRPLAFNESPVYGASADVWSYRCWHAIAENSRKQELEHPGAWTYRNMQRWDYGLVDYPHWMYRPYRFELDTEEDLELINRLYAAWTAVGDPKRGPIPLKWAVQYMDNNPGLQSVNAHVQEKTGPYTSFTKAEIDTWVKDYSNRDIVWAEVGLRGSIEKEHKKEREPVLCIKCASSLMTLSLSRTKALIAKCTECGEHRTLYDTKRQIG